MAKKDVEESVDKANERDAEELRKNAEAAKAKDAEETPEVDVDPEPPPEPEEREPGTRQARKNQRLFHNQQEMEEARNRNRDLETQVQAERARAAAAEQYLRMQAAQKEPGKDPHDAEIERIEREQLALSDLFNAKAQAQQLTQEEANELRKRYLKLQDERNQAVWKKSQPQAQPQQDPGRAAFMAQLRWDYADVVDEPSGRPWKYVNALADREVAAGRPINRDVIHEIMQETRKRFGLVQTNGRKAPSEAEKAKYRGAPSGGGQADTGSRTVKMTKANQQMAEAAYPHLAKKDPKIAWKKWAEEVGPTLAEKGLLGD